MSNEDETPSVPEGRPGRHPPTHTDTHTHTAPHTHPWYVQQQSENGRSTLMCTHSLKSMNGDAQPDPHGCIPGTHTALPAVNESVTCKPAAIY